MRQEFLRLIGVWIEAQIQLYQARISERRADYQRRNWQWNEDAVRDFNTRIEELRGLRTLVTNELTLGQAHGDNLTILANIVYNEAGTSNRNAKVAIAYAWLNRTGGTVREPVGNGEISNYQSLLNRWNGLGDIQRLTFLRNFGPSLSAARERLNDASPQGNDPTHGATHWVSPRGLPDFRNQAGRYARTVGTARNKAFPNWARSTTDPAVPQMQQRSQLGQNFAEITVTGVAREEFLFYIGVQ